MLTRLKTSTVAIAIVTKNLTTLTSGGVESAGGEIPLAVLTRPPTITSRMAWSEPCGLRRVVGQRSDIIICASPQQHIRLQRCRNARKPLAPQAQPLANARTCSSTLVIGGDRGRRAAGDLLGEQKCLDGLIQRVSVDFFAGFEGGRNRETPLWMRGGAPERT